MASLTLKNGKSIILHVGQYCSKDLKHKGLLDCTIVSVKLDCHKKIKIITECDEFKYINKEDKKMKKCVDIKLGCKSSIIVSNVEKKCSSSSSSSSCSSSSSDSCIHENSCDYSSESKCEPCDPTITLLGVGCAGSYLLNKLSKKYVVNAFDAGIDRRDDGFSYNLALAGPAVHNNVDNVAPGTTYTVPVGAPASFNWEGISYTGPWTQITQLTAVTGGTGPTGTWAQGIMLGGSSENNQGLYDNPSHNVYGKWEKLIDERFSLCNLEPKLQATEKFRSHTPSTFQTGDGTEYQPYDGPSELGSFPILRGDDGIIQAVQSAPSTFAENLSNAVYNYYRTQGYEHFYKYPIVDDKKSITLNSTTNLGATTSIERFLDVHRNRVSTARSYLNDSVMQASNADVPADAAAGYDPTVAYDGTVNYGPYVGINDHNFTLNLNKTIQRIVFKTKKGFPTGNNYWIQQGAVNVKAFVKPLEAIGIEYVDPVTQAITFVSSDKVIVSLGTLATPLVLMQSGIGPKALLTSLGIPVLHDQPNMGRHITGHIGASLKWTTTSPTGTWGDVLLGTDTSEGFLPIVYSYTGATGPTGGCKPCKKVKVCKEKLSDDRKFQYLSTFEVSQATPPVTNPLTPPNATIYGVNIYDLYPKSTGFIQPTVAYQGNTGTLLTANMYPNYYSKPIDIVNLCSAARNFYQLVINADSNATFYTPGPNAIFSDTDANLFSALMLNFVHQADQVGSCGMSKDCHGCVDTSFKLKGTSNVYVIDASSTPLEKDKHGNVYPVQSDGEVTRGITAFSIIAAEQFLHKL